ncbi:cys-tRNA(pro)/cys-tRNA(cys) deacylase [Kaistia sp. 32K]|uniref:YbaK/EbsC family protein n=1 Tax=Kaistia sp. 32K TaxID=2795690 RepID=UPI00191552BC|nr:YbaK/EbsC family protein [Kaistia sp. 32K]BCP54686.1 cys-tRNA(pro)/cys-tRNA(cys) deacylase [Kaistia sp. 32K]
MTELSGPVLRVAEAARSFGLDIALRVMPASTRTAEEAAAACECSVGEIVKSLVFRGVTSGAPILLLVSGSNRVDEKKVATTIGEPIERPDAAFVRAATGFAIGGIPPFAHSTRLACWFDRDLLAFERVFAAAGTPHALFAVSPAALQRAIEAPAIAMG